MKDHRFANFLPWHLLVAAGLMALAATVASAAPRGTMAPMNGTPPSHETATNVPFLSHGMQVDLFSLKGQPIMLWQVATWCPSCAMGLQTLADHQSLIDASNLKVLVLRDYKNGGYPGEGMEKFVAENAPMLLHDSHFIIGEDTEALFKLYNPRHYVDVYYLIAPNGQISAVSSGPAITFDKIQRFIKAEAKP